MRKFLYRSAAVVILLTVFPMSAFLPAASGQSWPDGQIPVPAYVTETIIREGVSMDLVSGPERDLPWEKDREFIKARLRNDTNVLLGAYRTVLRTRCRGRNTMSIWPQAFWRVS